MTFESGLHRNELEGLLYRPDFSDTLFKVAWYSIRTFKEAAMAVYKDPSSSEITVSNPLYADTANEEMLENMGALDAMESEYDAISDFDLRNIEYERRNDVVMHIHSHLPIRWKNIDPYETLRPSLDDLENDEQYLGRTFKTIGGIAVPHRIQSELSLLLYRPSESKELQTRHYQVLESEKREEVLSAMGRAGLNSTVIAWELYRPRDIKTDVQTALAELYA